MPRFRLVIDFEKEKRPPFLLEETLSAKRLRRRFGWRPVFLVGFLT